MGCIFALETLLCGDFCHHKEGAGCKARKLTTHPLGGNILRGLCRSTTVHYNRNRSCFHRTPTVIVHECSSFPVKQAFFTLSVYAFQSKNATHFHEFYLNLAVFDNFELLSLKKSVFSQISPIIAYLLSPIKDSVSAPGPA